MGFQRQIGRPTGELGPTRGIKGVTRGVGFKFYTGSTTIMACVLVLSVGEVQAVEGGYNPRRGRQYTILPNFPQKLHEIEQISGHVGVGLGVLDACRGCPYAIVAETSSQYAVADPGFARGKSPVKR